MMSGYVPTHGPDCETRTYKTRCSQCRKHVFFFACSCQSAVFFDSLGHPWLEQGPGLGQAVRSPGKDPVWVATEMTVR